MKSSPQKEMVMMITALKLRRIRDSFIIELLVSLGMVLDIKIPILICILLILLRNCGCSSFMYCYVIPNLLDNSKKII